MRAISKREKEVLHLIAYEYTAKEIAKKLYISAHTVNDHRKKLLTKMDAKNTAGLIRKGFEYGLLTIEASSFHRTYN